MGLESPEPAPTKDIDSGADRRISGAPKTVRQFGSFGTPPVREYAEPRVLLHIGLLVKSQLKGKEKVMADPETQEESQWIVPQRILSALTLPGFN